MRGDRRRAELEAEHKAATSPNRRRCMIEGCPEAGIWHATSSREESLELGRRHYLTRHYNPDPPYALRGLDTARPRA